jgi:type VI secretion system protein
MALVLYVMAGDPSLAEGEGRRIEVDRRFTIGRGGDNDLVLADPERHLSKNHCIIDFDGARFTVTDTSTNGVYLDDEPDRLPRDTPTPLHEGSMLRLGSYRIKIAAIVPSLAVRSAQQSPHGVAASGSVSGDDVLFGDPLGGTPMAGRPVDSLASPFGDRASASPMIPEDIDLFGGRAEEAWRGGSQPDHAPSDQAFFAPPKVSVETIPEDWEQSALGMPIDAENAQAARRRRSGRAEPEGMPAEAPALRVGIPGTAGDTAALTAFFSAAGLSGIALSDTQKVRVMKLAGEALALALKGLAEILAARASTKQEFRIERTAISAKRNNPLKFSGSANEAMRALLLGNAPGFLAANEAVAEAIKDIKGHQLAVLAGMQAALATVLARFDPAELEKRLEQASLVEGILPAARKARRWDRFKELYREIAAEIEDDFQKTFGAEFARAYRKQIDRL